METCVLYLMQKIFVSLEEKWLINFIDGTLGNFSLLFPLCWTMVSNKKFFFQSSASYWFHHQFYRYVGHLKERSLKDQMLKDPTEVIRKAVLRMLPRNKLRDVCPFLKLLILPISKMNYLFVFLIISKLSWSSSTLFYLSQLTGINYMNLFFPFIFVDFWTSC